MSYTRQTWKKTLIWGRILGRNPVKSFRSFLPCYSQSSLQLCLEIYIFQNSRNLLCNSSNSSNLLRISTNQLLYTVKEKGGKPDRKSIPPSLRFKKSLQVWELWKLHPETSTKLYVHEFHEFGFSAHFPTQHWGHCGRDGMARQESAGGPKNTLRGKVQVRPGAGPGGRASSVS